MTRSAPRMTEKKGTKKGKKGTKNRGKGPKVGWEVAGLTAMDRNGPKIVLKRVKWPENGPKMVLKWVEWS